MTVYHINKGIGMSSSGIEYAQKYRYDLVRGFPEKQFFVFCDYIYSNYTRFTDNIGIAMEATLSAYKLMAGQENHRSSYSVEAFAATLPEDYERVDATDGRSVDFKRDGTVFKAWLITDGSVAAATGMIDRVDTIVAGRLQEVAHYSDRLTNIDYYDGRKIFCRYFFDETGALSMRQFLDDNKILLTLVDGLVLQGSTEFYDEFFKRLHFGREDLVLIDRNTDLGPEMLQNKNGATYAVVVHAEHFSVGLTSDDWTLWNNYYEYVFTNYKYIDYFITSTARQTEKLKAQFATAGHPESRVITIPVGSVAAIADGATVESNKYQLLTASRLANEKHIDVLIKAVAKAHAEIPQLTFHIYGAGGLDKSLRELVSQLTAENYIVMEGHKDMAAEYGKYGGYLTASGSEGFGLTILEAVGACLPIIGLDVDYGNTTFVEDGVNGYLLSRDDEETQVAVFAAVIVKMLTTLDYDRSVEADKRLAAPYLSQAVARQWRDFYDLALSRDSSDARNEGEGR